MIVRDARHHPGPEARPSKAISVSLAFPDSFYQKMGKAGSTSIPEFSCAF
ncbi:hypothetical protein [Paracoccus sediminilitoris]|nr:hypothetical protein [Paracoccus sediminilitoris]